MTTHFTHTHTHATLGQGERTRVIVKRKIAEFAESRFDDNGFREHADGGDENTAGASYTARANADAVLYELRARLTEQRLASVLSKEGHPRDVIQRGRARAVLAMLCDDCMVWLGKTAPCHMTMHDSATRSWMQFARNPTVSRPHREAHWCAPLL